MKLVHTLLAIALTLALGLTLGAWWVGAAAGAAYFAGREIAQAEYRWIERHGRGLRANLGPTSIWTTPGIWREKSWLWDAVLPTAAVCALAYFAPSFDALPGLDAVRAMLERIRP
jgi:hypothetical protein